MKFRTKLTLCTICLLSLFWGIGCGIHEKTLFSTEIEKEKGRIKDEMNLALGAISLFDSSSYKTVLFNIGNYMQWDALVITDKKNKEVLIDDNRIDVYEPRSQYPGTNSICKVKVGKNVFLQVGSAVYLDDSVVSIDFYRDITDLYIEKTERLKENVRLTVLLVICESLVSTVISYFLTKPLSAVTNAAKELANGNMDARAAIKRSDESGELALAFNRMADKIEENMLQIKEDAKSQERFTGAFAHEMKTPMTAIIGYAEMLRGGILDPSEQEQALDFIFYESKRLEKISLRLLELQILKKGEINSVISSPKEIVERLCERYRPLLLQKEVSLLWVCEDGECFLDPDLVYTLLVNLLDNARKAIEGKGKIIVAQKMTDTGCAFRIADSGRGIPDGGIDHLKEEFYRVDKSRSRRNGGVGLGLSLCNQIVDLHSGKMSFVSREGTGTCVCIELNGGGR